MMTPKDIESLFESPTFKECLTTYLKEHLSISINTRPTSDYYSSMVSVEVAISLDYEEISKAADTITVDNKNY